MRIFTTTRSRGPKRAPQQIGDGATDLTTWAMEAFNSRYPNTPTRSDAEFVLFPKYFSTSADADRNGNEKLESEEATPYWRPEANIRYKILKSWRYGFLFRSVPLYHSTIYGTAQDRNDAAVTLRSARHDSFTEIAAMTGTQGRNHTTILGPTLAPAVLSWIRQAELQQTWVRAEAPPPSPPPGN